MNYTCPFCNQPTTITSPNKDSGWQNIDIAKTNLASKKEIGTRYLAIACPNTSCKQLSFAVYLTETTRDYYNNPAESSVIEEWQLLPDSVAKPQPSYIPAQIVKDYNEACKIRSLSPKASATLARRCLQGMIRDFHGVSKHTLHLEIEAIENMVSSEVWAAIDAVRSVGNIGAHFEKDVNLIIEIEPKEVDLLIGLLEDLFKEWYINKYDRTQRLKKIQQLAQSKKEAKKKPNVSS